MRSLILAALCALAPFLHAAGTPVDGDVLARDQWFVGELMGQPAMTLHVTELKHPDGTRTTSSDTKMVIRRSLGEQTTLIETSDTLTSRENAAGLVTSFTIDQDESGRRTSADCRVEGDQVIARVHRLGRIDEQRVKVPAGLQLLGLQASQEELARTARKPGDKHAFANPVLRSGAVQISRSDATVTRVNDDGSIDVDLVMDLAPTVVIKTTISKNGDLRRMFMDLKVFALELRPAPGPVALIGAEMALTGLFAARGTPKARALNRFKLPAPVLAMLPADGFQHRGGDTISVRAVAVREPLSDTDRALYLRAEPQLELDDPALRAWAQGLAAIHAGDAAAQAEALRLAVRSHIVVKDLTLADGSALETFRSRRGDCTEHSTLLTAALRIAGIPARSEVGLVFAPEFGNWVGHAWNSAYVGDRWVHLDSAYPGLPRTLYLRLASTTVADRSVPTGSAMRTAIIDLAGQEIVTVEE